VQEISENSGTVLKPVDPDALGDVVARLASAQIA
jgi:hypothetical protein